MYSLCGGLLDIRRLRAKYSMKHIMVKNISVPLCSFNKILWIWSNCVLLLYFPCNNKRHAVLVRARTRADFYFYHQSLHKYLEKMTISCNNWFAVHNFFFVVLVFTVVHEWFTLMKHKTGTEKYFNSLLVNQTAGSSMTAFAFAFPFISASRITSKFTKFYLNVVTDCKIPSISDLLILSNNSRFKLYGLCINTTAAVLAFLSSLTSLLRLCSGFKNSH